MLTRPSQMPHVRRFNALEANARAEVRSVEREAQAWRQFDRLMYFAGGVCVGFLILWAGLTF